MFNNCIQTVKNDAESDLFKRMTTSLEEEVTYMNSLANNDITSQSDFIKLHKITDKFYSTFFPQIYKDYVPLYHSLWKQRLRDVIAIDNIHQDGGIQLFSDGGYQSRMITIWTNLYK